MKGHLLASVCALSLVVAAPAFAAGGTGMDNGAPMNGTGMNGGPAMHTPGAPGSMNGAGNGSMGTYHDNGMPSERTNGGMANGQPGMGQAPRTAQRHTYSSRQATSQESEVERLNEESLRAAQQNRAFTPGGAGGEQGGMNQPGSTMAPNGGMSSGGMSNGGMQQPMQR